MPRPHPGVVGLLREWLALAEAGELRAVLLLGRQADASYVEAWEIDRDPDDMVLELRSTVIRLQCSIQPDESPLIRTPTPAG